MLGVLQGSIIGPLLYILYTNEIPDVPGEFTVLYAGDTTLILIEDNLDLLLAKVHNAVDIFDRDFSANDLLLNVSKTQAIQFCNRNDN